MSAQDLEQRARELLAAEYERERCPKSARAVRNNDAVQVDTDIAISVIADILRHQPAPVDLEQFREACNFMKAYGSRAHCVQADRLLSIIDNAGKVASVEAVQANVVYQLEVSTEVWCDCDEATFNWWHKSGGRNTRKLYTVPHQPAPVVDDARMARALEAARRELAPEYLPAIEEAIAAYDPNCGARTVRVVDDAMRALAANLVDEVDGLIGESGGVYGLHLNGDPSPWDELLPGGRFERLTSLDDLRAAIASAQEVQS